jgi:hypothetical protein
MSDIPSTLDTAKFRHLVLEKIESIAGFNLPTYTEVQFSNYNSGTPPQPGLITCLNQGVVVATITITFDGNKNITDILRTT